MIEEDIFKKLSIFLVLGVLLFLTGILLWPIASAIVTGLILAYIFYPAYKRVLKIVKEKNISAVIIILLVLFLIFVPLWFLLPLALKQVFEIYLHLQKLDTMALLRTIIPAFSDVQLSKDFASSLNNFITGVTSKILSSFSSILLNLPQFALKVAVVFVVFFFGIRDGEALVNYILSLSPFSKETEKELSEKFSSLTSSLIYGYVVIGIMQGVLTGIGIFVAGVPNSLVLTILAIFVSIIPVLGAWFIWIPAVIWLFTNNRFVAGVSLFVYGAVFVSWIDNIIRPYIISRKSKISSVIVLIGMIGGLTVFGILGIIIGPLILAYFLLVLEAYRNKRFPYLFSK